MKLSIQSAFVSLSSFCISLLAAAVDYVPSVINKVAEIQYEKSAEKAVVLLVQVQMVNYWGMGGGVGPTDRTSLTMLVLSASAPFLHWKGYTEKEAGANSQPQFQQWMQANPKSDATMLAMLSSDDPLARWMACEKIKYGRSVSPTLLPTLRTMAIEDERLLIGKRSVGRVPGESPRAWDEHIFDAPLRRDARELLALAGEQLEPLDQRQLSLEGLAWLGKLYVERVNDRLARLMLESALRQLAPITPEILAAQSGAQITRSPEEFLTLFQTLKNGGVSAAPGKQIVPAHSIETGGADANAQRQPIGGVAARPSSKGADEDIAGGGSLRWSVGAIVLLLLVIGVVYSFVRK